MRPPANLATRPRIGFLGVGWIGRRRLEALDRSGTVEIAGAADPALDELPGCRCVRSFDDLLAEELDGLVIATPNALHATQAVAALDAGLAVFCEKPLGIDASEARAAVEAAREADRLLGVDMSYRHLAAVRRLREEDIGEIFAVDLVFHNAYGPGKAWFYDRSLSGGGCVLDLGIHLVDLALWWLGMPQVKRVSALLHGEPVERYASAQLELEGAVSARLACSWELHCGQECVFEASFYGSEGSASIRNVGGSFQDFVGEVRRGTASRVVSAPPDDWGGRAALRWAERLSRGDGYDPKVEELVAVAAAIDEIYERSTCVSS
jgi:predicted dehydrogenase